jgi:solute carrier family 25 (mitochondrial carnitine/acylcarnitine transporter), member 20/29
MHQVLTGNPFDTVKVRLQVAAPPTQYSGFLDCAGQILRNEGVAGFYKGALTPLIGIGACVSVQFATLEAMKRVFAGHNAATSSTLSLSQLYAAGAASGLANSLLSGPIEHVRSRLQIQTGAASSTRAYAGPLDFARKVVAQHGPSALFKGQLITFIREFHGMCPPPPPPADKVNQQILTTAYKSKANNHHRIRNLLSHL